MNANTLTHAILKAVAILTGIVVLLWFLYEIQAVVIYIVIAAVISLIGRPMVLFLRRRLKFSNTVAVITTMFFFAGLLLGLVLLFIPLVIEQGHNLALLDINQLQLNIENLYRETLRYLEVHNINLKNSLKEWDILSMFNFSAIPNFLNALVSGLGSFSIGVASVLFISFFFLKDSKLFENALLTLIPKQKESRWKSSSLKIKDLLSRYFVGLILQIFILFVIYSIGLSIVGVNNAIVIAFLCALLNVIPYVGPIIAAFLMLTLTMTSNLGASFSEVILPKAMWVLVVLIIGQLIDNFLSQPIIFSKSVKSHPLEIFLIILIAGILFGIVGLIVAVPAYTTIKVVLQAFLSENRIVKKLTKNL
ncbi:MAG TPA: AI-2E family transporter [Flavobacteriaceae bacterium]|nr:AI-2E family transporter [Flavobacteriaceae bacterium]